MIYKPKESLIQFPSLWLPGSPLPSSRGMPGYPCCCDLPPCTQFEDNFTRADGGPGSDWDQVAGTWAIVSNGLTTSSSDGLCIYTGTLQLPYQIQLNFDFEADKEDDRSRLIFNYQDTSNFSYIETWFARPVLAEKYLTVVSRVGGSDSILQTFNVFGPNITLCVYDTYITLRSSFTEMGLEMTTTSSRCGIGTGSLASPTPFKFGGFEVNTPQDVNPECSETCPIVCNCADTSVSVFHDLEVTITGIIDEDCATCGGFNDTFILQITECSGANQAIWSFMINNDPLAACILETVTARISGSTGSWVFNIELLMQSPTPPSGDRTLDFDLAVDDDFDCSLDYLDGTDIPLDSNNLPPSCNVSSPTCTVTVLP